MTIRLLGGPAEVVIGFAAVAPLAIVVSFVASAAARVFFGTYLERSTARLAPILALRAE